MEMLIYLAILGLMLGVIINITISVVNSERLLRASRSVENSASIALERIEREVRRANSIDINASVFGLSPGTLVLETTDAFGNPKTIEFYISLDTIRLKENSVDSGALTGADVKVTNLVFSHFSGVNSEGVRIEMTIESGEGSFHRSEKFYSSAILR